MSNRPFSVSMCVYAGDDPGAFRQALDSVFAQTLPPDEVIVVVDGPVPQETETVLTDMIAHPGLRAVRLEQNTGHGNARRTGLVHCTHDRVALMDADDLCVPERFEKQCAFLDAHPEITAVGGQITEFIGQPENVIGKREVPLTDPEIRDYMRSRCPMNQVTVMFSAAAVERAGGYRDWYCEEDYYLWLRMALDGAVFANLPETLVHVRSGEGQYHRRGGRKYFRSEARLQGWMLKKHVIGFGRYVYNVAVRLAVQVLLPERVRGLLFRKFARKRAS